MKDSQASRTAVLVCQGRAVADGRFGPERFHDPTALSLLDDDEAHQVEVALSGTAPTNFGERLEYDRLSATGDVMAPRTIAIDEAISERPSPQLVILGAGLDGRAWRMHELAGTAVFEVDHPASQDDKRSRVHDLREAARSITFVPVDFTRDSLNDELAKAGHDTAIATTWIWEGVIPYLTRAAVESTLRTIADRSASGSRLVVTYQTPALSSTLGRVAVNVLTTISRRRNPLQHEPWRSSWSQDAITQLLARFSLVVVRDEDLLTVAGRTALVVNARRYLQHGRVATADLR